MHTGSICFGSLLVAVLAFFRVLVRSMKDRRLAFAACLVDWILIKIENMMKFFNTYAFVYIALYAVHWFHSIELIHLPCLCHCILGVCCLRTSYGKSYLSAANDTWEMIKTRGFDVIINDDLSYVIVFIGCLMGGILSGSIGAAWVVVRQLPPLFHTPRAPPRCVCWVFPCGCVSAFVSWTVATLCRPLKKPRRK